MYFEQYSRALNNVNYALLTNEFIGPIEHAIEQIDSIHNELQMERLLIEEQKLLYRYTIIKICGWYFTSYLSGYCRFTSSMAMGYWKK